jgi:hypothetical protein
MDDLLSGGVIDQNIIVIKALHYKLFSVKALSKCLWNLTKLTKQLIAIIIVMF